MSQDLFDLVWCRFGSQRPDGQSWTTRDNRRIEQPRTHAEFVEYLDAVSRCLYEEVTAWKGAAENIEQLTRERDVLRGAYNREAERLDKAIALNEQKHARILELEEGNRHREEGLARLREKLGAEWVDAVIEGREPCAKKRKIRL